MDFFQFLKNSSESNTATKRDKQTKQKIDKQNVNLNTNANTTFKTATATTTEKQTDNVALYKKIKKGDFVKIIHLKNSYLNAYKGYNGEIRDYKYGQDEAMIFLHCINSQTFVKFPLEHFILNNS
jgi:hypothetical protein